jgi:predicted NUDIX family phosphoesterase
MAKLALCIKLADAPSEVIGAFKHSDTGSLIPINSEFWNTPVQLVDRSICETDESLLQLLPYITLEDEDSAFFMYTRGGGGEEARLHGNYSIGVGGHVDIAPAEGQTLLEVLQAEAAREYLEETGLVADPSMFTITHFICDPTNAVGRVHLGLLTSLKLSADDRAALGSKLEAGVIENTCMARAPYLLSTEVYARLENWSKLIADTMFNPETAQPDEANDSSFSFNELGASAEAEAAQGDGEEDDTCYECDLPAENCECHQGEEAGDSGDEGL